MKLKSIAFGAIISLSATLFISGFDYSIAASYSSEMSSCVPNSPWVVGYDHTHKLVYLSCGPDAHLHPESTAPQINQATGKPNGAIPAQAIAHSSNPSSPVSVDPQCAADPLVPAQWSAVQKWSLTYLHCARPYRYVTGNINFGSPKTSLTPDSAMLPINNCKLSTAQNPGPGSGGRYFGQPETYLNPTLSGKFLVIPVQFSDDKATTNPENDYGKYFQFISDYVKNSSDVPASVSFDVPNHYVPIANKIASYNIGAGRNNPQFLADVAAAIKTDTSINTDGVDEIIIVAPPTTSPALFANITGPMGNPDGVLPYFPHVKGIYVEGSPSLVAQENNIWTADPWITAHEAINHHMGLDDSSDFGDSPANGSAMTAAQLGTGSWGNMSGVNGELLIWDKWLAGFEDDSQIRCAPTNATTTTWLAPSTTKSNLEKGLIIPTSATTAIVVESERSTGYNFKFPKSSNGALVYTIDSSITQHGMGVQVLSPKGRPPINWHDDYSLLQDSTLKQGESLSVSGLKITNVEAGAFGDVIKVSPLG